MSTRETRIMDNKYLGVLIVAGVIALSACGQRTDESLTATEQTTFDNNGNAVDGDGGPALGAALPENLNLRVLSNVNSINTGGTDVANITALVTDENNNAVAAQAVTFSSTGGVLQNISTETDENGEASATLKLPQDFQNQDIIVTVSAETFDADVRVSALGSKLEVSGPDTLVSGDKAELVMSLVAGNGEPIANQVVNVQSSAGNTIEPATVVTDPDGRASITVGTENSNDTIRISALNGSVNATHNFEVAADILRFADGTRDAELPVSQNNTVVVSWTSDGTPVTGRDLVFSTTAGEIVGFSTVRSNLAGEAPVILRSNSAGPATITVEGPNGTPKTSIDVEFVAINAHRIAIDASSSRVHTNETSTILATVTDLNGNPVKNKVVDFTSADLKGGQLNPASAKSNSAGVASVTFTAGDNATDLNDIEIQASVKGTSLIDVQQLTVVKRVLNVTLGTSNEINIKPLGTQYALPFIVQVADGSGSPLEDATVKLSIRPIEYSKGSMVLVNEEGFPNSATINDWSADHWERHALSVTCNTEDTNGNRFLDVGEDVNDNGSLDPQDPASLVGVDGGEFATIEGDSISTDKNGSGFFEMLYPASNSQWAYVEITARAEALGAEADTSFKTTLPLPGSERNTTDEIPANYVSPYGQALDCTSTD